VNLLATNYFIATEAELPEIYAVYLEKLAEINANPGVTIVLLSDTEEPAEHQSVYEELLQKYAEIHSIGGKKLELYQLDTVVKLDGVTDAAQAHKLLTEFAPTDDRYPSVLSSKVLVYDILPFLAVALNDELLHLLNSKLERNNLRDTEEC